MQSKSSTSTSSRRSVFLELPAELRNRIYGYALYHDRNKGELGAVNILSACRQIYNEAKELLFENSTFTIAITTPYTPWWDIENSRWTGKHTSRTRTLAITGDLEVYFHGKRKPGILVDCGTPPPEVIYDSFPAALRKVTHVHVKLELICYRTAQFFLYALACFLNTPGCKYQELHLHIEQPQKTSYQHGDAEPYDTMWYALAKLPSQVRCIVSGALVPTNGDHDPAGLHINHRFMRDQHAHPDAPKATKTNTIEELKRVNNFAYPILAQAVQEFEDKTRDCHTLPPGVSWLAFEIQCTLVQVKSWLREGEPPRSCFNGWVDYWITCDLNFIETYAKAILEGKPLCEVSEVAEHRLKQDYGRKRADDSEYKRWLNTTSKELRAEIERRRVAGELDR